MTHRWCCASSNVCTAAVRCCHEHPKKSWQNCCSTCHEHRGADRNKAQAYCCMTLRFQSCLHNQVQKQVHLMNLAFFQAMLCCTSIMRLNVTPTTTCGLCSAFCLMISTNATLASISVKAHVKRSHPSLQPFVPFLTCSCTALAVRYQRRSFRL